MAQSGLTLEAAARQAPLSTGYPRQEYQRELSFPPPGDPPNPGIKPMSLASAGGFFTPEPPRSTNTTVNQVLCCLFLTLKD